MPKLIAPLLVAATLAVAGPAEARVKVVTTLTPHAAVTKAVGGTHVDVMALATHNQDAHYVDARPSFLVPLSRADLLIVNGLDLEVGWLPPLLTNARNPKIRPGGEGYLDGSRHVRRLGAPTGVVSRDQGDVHAGGNPHYALDPSRMAELAIVIGDRLALIRPDLAPHFKASAKRVAGELRAFAELQRKRFGKLSAAQRKVVCYHESTIYLAAWLGLREAAFVEPKPGIAPSPGHVAKVLKHMRNQAIKAVVQEAYYPANVSKRLASLAQAKLVTFTGGPQLERGETYLAWSTRTAEALHAALAR